MGMRDLSYLEGLLTVPSQDLLGRTERWHLKEFFEFFGIDEPEARQSLIRHFEGFVAVRDMVSLPNDPGASLAPAFGTEELAIRKAIDFSKFWLSRWKSCRDQHTQLNRMHIAAIDYLAGSILRVYMPQGVAMRDVEALLQSVTV